MKTTIQEFIAELKKCEYVPSSSKFSQEFKYNGIKYSEGVESYNKILNNMYEDFKSEIWENSQKARFVLEDIKTLKDHYYDVPREETIERMQLDQNGKNIGLKDEMKEAIFLNDMVRIQKYYTGKTISFLEHILTEQAIPTANISMTNNSCSETKLIDRENNETESKNQEIEPPQILRGVRDFAKHLGIGNTKASAIAKSKILPSNIQYRVGKTWYFNVKKMDKFIEEHPKIFHNS